MKYIQKRLKGARIENGWTQNDLSLVTGFTPAAISHYETGQRTPSIENLMKLCDALGKTPNEILLNNKQRIDNE